MSHVRTGSDFIPSSMPRAISQEGEPILPLPDDWHSFHCMPDHAQGRHCSACKNECFPRIPGHENERNKDGALSVELVRSTHDIPAEVGTRFGFRYRINGQPEGAPVKISIVVVFPDPGLKTPGKTFATPDLRYYYKGKVGETAYFSYFLEHFWQVMEGPWAFELWCQGRRLAKKQFTLAVPSN